MFKIEIGMQAYAFYGLSEAYPRASSVGRGRIEAIPFGWCATILALSLEEASLNKEGLLGA